jgi:DnaK suppressor protein
MRKRDLNFFRNLLTRRLEELLMEAERTRYQVKENDEPASDPMELASNQFDRDFLLRLRDRERKLMVKIKEAVERIENGTFGICEECGEKISQKPGLWPPFASIVNMNKRSRKRRENTRSHGSPPRYGPRCNTTS